MKLMIRLNRYIYEIDTLNNVNEESNSFEYEYKNKLIAKFQRKYDKGNFIYYECCKRRKGCCGKCKYNKNTKTWYMLKECNKDIIQDIKNFNISLISIFI